MKRRCLNNGGRERAFWGALIPAAVSLIGTGLSIASQSRAQRSAMEEERRLRQQQFEREQLNQTANTLNNYFTTSTVDDRDYEYAKGGRRRLRNAGGFMLTDGGPVVNINTGEAMYPGDIVYPGKYINLGAKHNQKNAQGGEGTGWIAPNGKRFESEAGEGELIEPDKMIIYSAREGKNGISYANKFLSGENPYNVEREQAEDNRRKGRRKLSSNGRTKALDGATFTLPDHFMLGTNILGSLLSGISGSRGYNELLNELNYNIPEYVRESYVAGPTRVYDEAKRAAIRRQDINARNDILNNTASANVGLDKSQIIGTNAMYETMKVAEDTTNKNIENIRANAERQQGVWGRNASNENAHNIAVANIRNSLVRDKIGLIEGKYKNNIGMWQGIGNAIGGYLQQGIDNYQHDQDTLMYLASSPYGTAERLANMGVRFSKGVMRGLLSDSEFRASQYENDTSERGIKNYNQAMQSVGLWRGRLNNPRRKNKRNTLYDRFRNNKIVPNTIYDYTPSINGFLNNSYFG